MCDPSCVAPAFCHGVTSPTCETTTYTYTPSIQCADFLAYDSSLTTLELAEQACSANENCTAITDLYCNGLYDATDYFALCSGPDRVADAYTCIWEVPTAVPSPPAPPPSCGSEGACPPGSFCHGTVLPTCEKTDYTWTNQMQCSSFIEPYDTSLTTLELAEAACSQNESCTAISDLYCNGMYDASDFYVLCEGPTYVADSYTCIWTAPAPDLGIDCVQCDFVTADRRLLFGSLPCC